MKILEINKNVYIVLGIRNWSTKQSFLLGDGSAGFFTALYQDTFVSTAHYFPSQLRFHQGTRTSHHPCFSPQHELCIDPKTKKYTQFEIFLTYKVFCSVMIELALSSSFTG